MIPPILTVQEKAEMLGDALPDAEICRRLEDAELAFASLFRSQPRMRTRALTGGRICRELREELELHARSSSPHSSLITHPSSLFA
jgi:hypothetical protein